MNESDHRFNPSLFSLDHLAHRVFLFVKQHNLMMAGEKAIVAVSGGPDSVCLLHILHLLQEEIGMHIHVAHLDHMLRGEDSRADAEYVRQLCQASNIPVTLQSRDVQSYRAQQHLSLEEAARYLRYEFLAQVAQTTGANLVVVGHTSDDQVETVLMNLIRGTGLQGLAGMQPHTLYRVSSGNQVRVVRPLLCVSRTEVQQYCQDHDLKPREDNSNGNTIHLRNCIRHELIPLLKSYNPSIKECMLNTTQIMQETNALLDSQIRDLWEHTVVREDNTMILDKEKISSQHVALQNQLIREVFRQLLGDLTNIERKHIEIVRKALSFPSGKSISLPRGLVLYVEYNRCIIGADLNPPLELIPIQGERRLQLPGETQLPGWRVEATFKIIGPVACKWPLRRDRFPHPLSLTAYIDPDVCGNDLTVRTRKPGDRFQPLGMSESKKLQDFMVDAHIPKAWRDRIPLVCSSEQILWVVGWRINNTIRVTENTRRILRLTFQTAS
ncbi:MAG: tRNA lysidine(34) synthetase TilS [Chloroflexota bacterium]|nr:tRNA lysidine(34) synthetase TilS [Chloroflexota bacterium]